LTDILGDEPVAYSGDVVQVDCDGDLWFVGRYDEMIKTSGFRVSPTEVEDAVSKSGLVEEVVAYGVEDDDLGQVVHIVVVVSDTFDKAKLSAYCRSSMPGYMVPREIHVNDRPFPRTASGKFDRPTIITAAKHNFFSAISAPPEMRTRHA
jgi:acyl-coenzyme A synthetase/AMP-(fatty) acid ligase